jgi:LysR family transcriptional regulator (chromosome initiation inhibitor)
VLGKHNCRALPFIAFNRKDDMQGEIVNKAVGLKGALLDTVFVPSSEGQVRALRAGWGAALKKSLRA